VGRDAARLEAVAADLRCRGGKCFIAHASPADPARDWDFLLEEHAEGRGWDWMVVAHGALPEQERCLANAADLAEALQVNFTSAVTISAACARQLDRQGTGTLAVFGSVAGDRGRGSNFVYGSAKAGLDVYLAGLRHHFAGRPGIRVVTLKPGMTDTPMTAHMPKGPLFSPAETVGRLAWEAIRKGRSNAYLPGWWRGIMWIIRMMPEALLHRTKL
jgi:decaprenylphospho-beta-D-erythro-pentofuranosid-2-ulose 2-reductase